MIHFCGQPLDGQPSPFISLTMSYTASTTTVDMNVHRGHWANGRPGIPLKTTTLHVMNYIVTQLGHNVYYKSPKKVQTRSENSSPLTLMSDDDEEDVDKVQIAPLSHTHLKMCLLWSMIPLTQHLLNCTTQLTL